MSQKAGHVQHPTTEAHRQPPGRPYSLGEEIANSITHGAGQRLIWYWRQGRRREASDGPPGW